MIIQHAKNGWKTVSQQRFVILILFIYQMAWGIWLYRFVQSIVIPILHRYPGSILSSESVHLFFAEAQFRLMKTELIQPYLWTLLIMLAIRVGINPIINAGVYYSLFHHDLNGGYRFIKGIRSLSTWYFLYYFIQLVLTWIPFYWIGPHIWHQFLHSSTRTGMILSILPWIVGYLIYGFILQLVTMYIQFGKAGEGVFWRSIFLFFRQIFPVLGIFLILILIALLLTGMTFIFSMVWAGLGAVIFHQIYYLIRTILKLWGLSAQYHLWVNAQ